MVLRWLFAVESRLCDASLSLLHECTGWILGVELILHATGERKDFEVYSCDVSPDGKRLVTAAGGKSGLLIFLRLDPS